jgi:Predicted Zn-dependent peptidases
MSNMEYTMKKQPFSIVICLIMSLFPSVKASSPLQVQEYRLSNGLSVWLNEDHSQPKIFGVVVVKAGSKDCPNTGIAHYFEHMMFKGTDKIGTINYPAEKILLDSVALKYDELAATRNEASRTRIQKEINALSVKAAAYAIPNEFDRLMSRYGGTGLNAATSDDVTFYYNQFSPSYLRQWAELYSERLINPVFRLFQSELETVYEEKNMYNDMVGSMAVEKVLERFFSPHPYAYPIVGSVENLKNPQLSQMQKFFQDYYVAGNMGLILSGDFRTDEVLPILEKTFSRIKAGTAPKKEVLQPKPLVGKECFDVLVPIPLIKLKAMCWRGVPVNHEDEVALSIISGLLNNESGTGYLDKLTVDGKVLQAACMSQSFNEAGLFAVLVVPKILFQSEEKASALVMKEVERIKKGDFSDEAFNSLKLEQKRSYEKQLEDIDSRARKMLSVFAEGKSWEDYLGEVGKIDALSREDVVRVANKYFTENYLAISKKTGNYPKNKLTKPDFAPIIPPNMEAESEYAKSLKQIDTLKAVPRFLDFSKDAEIVHLSPLVALYATPNPVNDIFTLDLEYGKGTLESKMMAPMSTYVSLLGTDSLSFSQFREKLQALGGSLAFEATPEKFIIRISGFDNRFDETFALASHFMKHLKADPKKVRQLADAAKIERKAELESPDKLAEALLDKVRYGQGSEFLNRLSLSEIKKLKGENLVSAFREASRVACEMHYCGCLSSDRVAAKIKEYMNLNDINISSKGLLYRELKPVEEPAVYFIHAPKASQSIVEGYIPGGVNADVRARCQGNLFNSYFGGNMGSIVFQQIREFRSLAYRAKASFRMPSYLHRDKPGYLSAFLSTQCDKTSDAVAVLDSLLRMMPVREERVQMAKQEVVNGTLNDFPSFREISSRIANLQEQGYDTDPSKIYMEMVKTMDINDIVAFYDRNIKDRKMVYLVVGNKNQIDMKKLAAFGKIVRVKPCKVLR